MAKRTKGKQPHKGERTPKGTGAAERAGRGSSEGWGARELLVAMEREQDERILNRARPGYRTPG